MPNRLASEKSPYLLQHAHNPVDWYPWGDEAFEAARREDKPIFLSIGYATCHWCHVMERESFEDPVVAQLLNLDFVSIKVDREERPDIDQIYMTVCQMLTGHGGWPLTIVMAPDRRPFYAATYIPRDSRYGRPGMVELLPRIHELWTTDRTRLTDSAERIVETLKQGAETDLSDAAPDEAVLDEAYHQLAARFDSVHGGFGPAPKFPMPHNLVFLLRYGQRRGLDEARHIAVHTLERMRAGGVYDHLGFGFHRYATDDRWLVPHFEKMLYDQAGMVAAYLEARRATGNPIFSSTAREILGYVQRDLTSPDGAFYSAEDADSEGEEGRFYVWSSADLREILSEDEARLAESAFGFREEGNYRDESTHRLTGANIPHTPIGGDRTTSPDERLEAIRVRLLEARSRRVRPLLDDKILTDWNGLMIGAFARAACDLADESLYKAASRAADFVLRHLRTPDGALQHRYRDGEAGLPAHLDDYAFLVDGLIELYQAGFEARYLSAAVDLTSRLIRRFTDPQGGYSFTAVEEDPVLVRLRETHDGATPSGNSVGLLNLIRLARLTGDFSFDEEASRLMAALSAPVRRLPSAHTRFLTAVDFLLGPSFEIVVVGEPDAVDTRAMLDAVRDVYVPRSVVHLKHTGNAGALAEIAPFTAAMTSLEGRATAYVCRGHACERPTLDAEEVRKSLEFEVATEGSVPGGAKRRPGISFSGV